MSVERIEADYLIETAYDLATAVAAMAGEQSSGTFVPVPGETPELKARSAARVEKLEVLGDVDRPSLPGSARSRRWRAPRHSAGDAFLAARQYRPIAAQPMATVAGNLFELKQFSGLRILDLRLPDAFANAYPGPKFGVDGHPQADRRAGTAADRHHRQTVDRLHAGADRRAGGYAVCGAASTSSRTTSCSRTGPLLSVREARARGDAGDQSARRAQRAESHVRLQPDRRDRRNAPPP